MDVLDLRKGQEFKGSVPLDGSRSDFIKAAGPILFILLGDHANIHCTIEADDGPGGLYRSAIRREDVEDSFASAGVWRVNAPDHVVRTYRVTAIGTGEAVDYHLVSLVTAWSDRAAA